MSSQKVTIRTIIYLAPLNEAKTVGLFHSLFERGGKSFEVLRNAVYFAAFVFLSMGFLLCIVERAENGQSCRRLRREFRLQFSQVAIHILSKLESQPLVIRTKRIFSAENGNFYGLCHIYFSVNVLDSIADRLSMSESIAFEALSRSSEVK